MVKFEALFWIVSKFKVSIYLDNSANSRKRKRSMISTSYLNGNGTGEGSNNNNNGGGGGITPFGDLSELLTGSMIDGYRFIEKFNRDMMDQFMEYQKRVVSRLLWYLKKKNSISRKNNYYCC